MISLVRPGQHQLATVYSGAVCVDGMSHLNSSHLDSLSGAA
jgi:hypothetical protein